MNVGNTAQDRVPGIRTQHQGIVVHSLENGGKGIEAHHPLQQGEKGMKADHALVQIEHDHVQKAEAVTVTHTPEVIQVVLFIADTGTDHEQDHDPILGRETVTNIDNLPKGNHVID